MRQRPIFALLPLAFLLAAAGCADPATRRLARRQTALEERRTALEAAIAALEAGEEGRMPASLAQRLDDTAAALAADREACARDLAAIGRTLDQLAGNTAELAAEASRQPRPLTREALARLTRETQNARRRRRPRPQLERTIGAILENAREGITLTPEQERQFAELAERAINEARENPPPPGTRARELVRRQGQLRQELAAAARQILTPGQRQEREWRERLWEMTEDYLDEVDDAADFNDRQYDQVDEFVEAEVARLMTLARAQQENNPNAVPAVNWAGLEQRMRADADRLLQRILSPRQLQAYRRETGPPLPAIQPQDLPGPNGAPAPK